MVSTVYGCFTRVRAICEGVVSRNERSRVFPLSTLLLENELPFTPSKWLSDDREGMVSIVHGRLLENERVWFPLPPGNKSAHFPLDRVAICVLTTLFGEATKEGLVLFCIRRSFFSRDTAMVLHGISLPSALYLR